MTSSTVSRGLAVLGSLFLCFTVGVLMPSCDHNSSSGDGATVSGGTAGALSPIGDISGGWVVSIFTKSDDCDETAALRARIVSFLVIQAGSSIDIVAEDGSDLPDVIDGSIQGTLTGDRLEFSYTVQEDEGTREFVGVVQIGSNLRSFWSPAGTCVSWEFSHENDAKQDCSGADVWTGQFVDIARFTDSGEEVPTDDVLESEILVEQDEVIAETRVNVDVEAGFAADLEMAVQSPAGTSVTLSTDIGEDVGSLNLFYSDTGVPFGQLPPRRSKREVGGSGGSINAQTGVQMRMSEDNKDSLSDFSGESSLGEWTLELSYSFDAAATLNSWGLLMNLERSPVNVGGNWIIEIFTKGEICGDLVVGKGVPEQERVYVLVEQNGSEISIVNGDGSPFEDIVGGVIEGTLDGAVATISYAEDIEGDVTTWDGQVHFGDNVSGNRSQQLSTSEGISWSFTREGDKEPLCTGVDFWFGRKLDTQWDPELIACSGPDSGGPLVLGLGETSAFLDVDDDVTIGELEVLADIRAPFFEEFEEIRLRGPDELAVTLLSFSELEADAPLGRINLLWAERNSLDNGDFPPIDYAACACRMEPDMFSPLSQFEGVSTQGFWRLDLVNEGAGDDARVDEFCLIVNDEVPPPGEIFEVCSDNTPIDYDPENEPGVLGSSAQVIDTVDVKTAVVIESVEVSVDVTQVFIGDAFDMTIAGPSGTIVALMDDDISEGDDLQVIWSDDGVPYASFPKDGGTTFGGRMQPVSSFNDGGLSQFQTLPSDGEWTLQLESFVEGTLNDWCVTIEENP